MFPFFFFFRHESSHVPGFRAIIRGSIGRIHFILSTNVLRGIEIWNVCNVKKIDGRRKVA